MSSHSGTIQIANPFTVAGAVLALPESYQSAPTSRLTFKVKKTLKAPEVRGAQTTELKNQCQVLRAEGSLVNLSFEPEFVIYPVQKL
ncbi:hypothetical protein SAMN05421754_101068 [Nitrosomonas sp. Nm58]|nr:hypothetical protein SAMN05421754_101068 [Nitrosomonas sp. Nm58]